MNPTEERYIPINGKLVKWEGQGKNHAPVREASHHVPYKPPPLKRDMQRDIYNFVYDAGRAVTAREVAAGLGITKSSWLFDHLNRLVTSRRIRLIKKPYRPNMPMYFYEVTR